MSEVEDNPEEEDSGTDEDKDPPEVVASVAPFFPKIDIFQNVIPTIKKQEIKNKTKQALCAKDVMYMSIKSMQLPQYIPQHAHERTQLKNIKMTQWHCRFSAT